jgi:hypothetical protein
MPSTNGITSEFLCFVPLNYKKKNGLLLAESVNSWNQTC